jgi:hypothetical protein
VGSVIIKVSERVVGATKGPWFLLSPPGRSMWDPRNRCKEGSRCGRIFLVIYITISLLAKTSKSDSRKPVPPTPFCFRLVNEEINGWEK